MTLDLLIGELLICTFCHRKRPVAYAWEWGMVYHICHECNLRPVHFGQVRGCSMSHWHAWVYQKSELRGQPPVLMIRTPATYLTTSNAYRRLNKTELRCRVLACSDTPCPPSVMPDTTTLEHQGLERVSATAHIHIWQKVSATEYYRQDAFHLSRQAAHSRALKAGIEAFITLVCTNGYCGQHATPFQRRRFRIFI